MRAERIAWWVVGALALRLVADVLLGVTVLGHSLGHLLTGASLVVLGGAALGSWPRLRPDARFFAAAWGSLFALAFARSGGAGVTELVRYGSGILVFASVAGWWGRDHARVWPMALLATGAVAALASLLGLGGSEWEYLHGTWRYRGPYEVLHALALGMGLVGGVGLAVAMNRQRPLAARWLAGGLAVVALGLVAASATRSGVVFAGVVALGAAAYGRRWRALGLSALGLLVLVVAVPGLRERSWELLLALTGTAPDEGWLWLGTGRVAIWSRSLAAFSDLPWTDQLGGLGLGGFRRFWIGKEPHSELLALLYQTGPLGVALFLVTSLYGLWRAWRLRRRPQVALAGGLLLAVLITSCIGSTLLVRLSVSWAYWAALGLLFSAAMPDESRSVPPEDSW